MIEIFYEESTGIADEKKERGKFNLFKTISIVFFVLLGLWVFFIFFFFDFSVAGQNVLGTIIFIGLPLVGLGGSGVYFAFLKNKYCIDYDYTFVSGSVRFSKVINNVKRKAICKFDVTDVSLIGNYGSEEYERIEKTPQIKKLLLTSNEQPAEGKGFYYIYATVDVEKKLLVLECTETFLINFIKYRGRSIIEKDFGKKTDK